MILRYCVAQKYTRISMEYSGDAVGLCRRVVGMAAHYFFRVRRTHRRDLLRVIQTWGAMSYNKRLRLGGIVDVYYKNGRLGLRHVSRTSRRDITFDTANGVFKQCDPDENITIPAAVPLYYLSAQYLSPAHTNDK